MKSHTRVLLAGTLSLTLGLSACGGGGEDDDRASSMYTWLTNQSDRNQWEAFVEAAQQDDPDFDISLEGPSFEDYWTTVHTRMGASDAPCILTTQSARTQELHEVLMPLDDLAEQHGLDIGEYNEAMIEGMTVDGELRAIPYDAQPVVLYYNKDLFDEAGVEHPGAGYTREQYVSDLQQITDETEADGVAVSPGFGSTPGLVTAFADGIAPVAGDELQLTDPAFAESIQWGFDLIADHGLGSAPSSGDPSDINLQHFISGGAATIMDGPWFYETIFDESEAEIGVAPIPSEDGESQGMIQGSGFGIAQSCDDPETAFENIMTITTPEVLSEVGRNRGVVPSVESAVEGWAETKTDEATETVEALLENGLPLETTDDWNQVEVTFSQSSGEGFRGSRTAEEILQMMEDSVQ